MDDWEDLLDDDKDIQVKKEGETGEEVVEEKKKQVYVKKEPQQSQNPNKKKRKKKKKRKVIEIGNDEGEERELNQTEKEKLDAELKKNKEKDIENIFGIEKNPLDDFKLEKERDYQDLAQTIGKRLEDTQIRKHLISFAKTILGEISVSLRSDDLSAIKDKLNVLINQKIKKEKGKDKKKKKGPSLNVQKNTKIDLYEDFQMDDEEGDPDDYKGKDDDYDFM